MATYLSTVNAVIVKMEAYVDVSAASVLQNNKGIHSVKINRTDRERESLAATKIYLGL
jgi:hypothetical protein